MSNTDTFDLVLSAVENALYNLADAQQLEETEAFLDYSIERGDKAVHLYLDDGTVISVVAQQEAQ